jgi:LPXTG-motif cell wall-anchored protein
MLMYSARRRLALLGVAGALLAASASPAVAAGSLRVLAADVLIAPGSSSYQEVGVALDGDEPAGAALSLEFDLSEVDRLITVEPPSDGWDCARAGQKLRCEAWEDLPSPSFPYWAATRADVAAGDRGDLPITATYAGRKASRTVTVTVGEGVDLESEREDSAEGEPGSRVGLPGGVRNRGQKTVHGAVLVLRPHRLSPYVGNFSNCAYRDGQPAVCRFDTDLEAGSSYRLSHPLPVRLDDSARTGTRVTSRLEWRTKDDWALIENDPDSSVPPGRPGTGEELRLVEVAARRAAVPQTDTTANSVTAFHLKVTGDSTADLATVGSTVTGRVGDRVKARAGVKNLGPAFVEAGPVTLPVVRIQVPEGTTALTVPGKCAPYSGGEVWNPSDFWGVPGEKQYGCLLTTDLAMGDTSEYEFTLRLDRLATETSGVVRAHLDGDSEPGNDKAAITVRLASTDGGGQGGDGGTLPITGTSTGLIAGIGGLLLVAGVGALLVTRRGRNRFVG